MARPHYDVKLGKAYRAQGFINIGVAASRYLSDDDKADLILDVVGLGKLEGHFDRTTNSNRTPRVFGGTKLRDWFNQEFEMGEIARVYFVSQTEIRVEKVVN